VDTQEIQQQPAALAPALEQLAGKPPVEEFHATADGTGLVHFRKAAQERFQVDLQQLLRAVVVAVNEAFLDLEKPADRYFLDGHQFRVQPQIAPAPDPYAQGEVDPGGIDDGLLGSPQHTGNRRAAQVRGVPFPAKSCKGILQIATQQKGLAEIMQLVQHLVGVVALFLEVALQGFQELGLQRHDRFHASINGR
jgi:hypothetical protein